MVDARINTSKDIVEATIKHIQRFYNKKYWYQKNEHY